MAVKLSDSVKDLEDTIAAEEAKNPSVYAQRNDLISQIEALREQLAILDRQIVASESDELKAARSTKAAFDIVAASGPRILRRFGLGE